MTPAARLRPVLAAALIALAGPALAFDAGDKAAVEAKVAELATAMKASDGAAIVAMMPPSVIEAISGLALQSPEDVTKALTMQVSQTLALTKVQSFTADLAAMETGDTPTGRPYALIPTTVVYARADAAPETSHNVTVALKDNGGWALMRVTGPEQAGLLHLAFPDFAKIEIPGEAAPGD